jgi:hypothetical protein
MSGGNNVVGGEIEIPVDFVIYGVSKKNTSGGLGCQFMSSFGGEIGIACATEHALVLIVTPLVTKMLITFINNLINP